MARKDPIAHLSRHRSELPERLIEEVLAVPDVTGRLIALASDPQRRVDDPVAVANAAVILGYTRDLAAIQVLVDLWSQAGLDELSYARTRWGIQFLAGPDLVSPLLDAPLEGERWTEATELLSWCGVADPRIEERVAELVRRDPMRGARAAVKYGEPRLVPLLQAALDARLRAGAELRVDDEDEVAEARHPLNEAVDLLLAISSLGVEDPQRTAALRAALVRSTAEMRAELDEMKAFARELEQVRRLRRTD